MADATRLRNRLRMARERRGLSRQAVADELGLPRTTVTDMESGDHAISTLDITKLIEIYGCSAAFLLAANEEPEARDLPVGLHRTLPEMEHAPEVDAAARRLLDLYREGETLRQMLDLTMEPAVPNYAMRMTNVDSAIQQGETVAQEGRHRFGIKNKPLDSREPPEMSEQELRSQLMRLAIEAFRQEEISRGRLVEIGRKLGIGGDALLELAEATRPG